MTCATSLSDLQPITAEWHKAGDSVALVPVLDTTHTGHAPLIAEAAEIADRVIISMPPGTRQAGLDAVHASLPDGSCDLVYAPQARTDAHAPDGSHDAVGDGMGGLTRIVVPQLSDMFEGKIAPAQFQATTTMLITLMLQTAATSVIFGEADFQQAATVRRAKQDLHMACDIMIRPMVREEDGLACTSANLDLDPAQRRVASYLNRRLARLVDQVSKGRPAGDAQTLCKMTLLDDGFDGVDYVQVVSDSLTPLTGVVTNGARVLAAARIGTVRLLDTAVIPPATA